MMMMPVCFFQGVSQVSSYQSKHFHCADRTAKGLLMNIWMLLKCVVIEILMHQTSLKVTERSFSLNYIVT